MTNLILFKTVFDFMGKISHGQCLYDCEVKLKGKLPRLDDVPRHSFVNANDKVTTCKDYELYGKPCRNLCTPSCAFWLGFDTTNATTAPLTAPLTEPDDWPINFSLKLTRRTMKVTDQALKTINLI